MINNMNGKLIFDGAFLEIMKSETHEPCSFLFEEHKHRRRIHASIMADDTCVKQFLNNFLNLILLGKGMMIWEEIGRNTSWD
jgi:hypothetical protein